ncbi:MAG: hypothetical protein QM478_11095 [Flavobacteriaceae bacterium]
MTESELTNRIKNALIILKDGNPFNVGELLFLCENIKIFSITGWSTKTDLNNLTQEFAINELEEIKSVFNKMTSVSTELNEFIKNRQIIYHLNYDSGKGGIEICTETNGQLKWNVEL